MRDALVGDPLGGFDPSAAAQVFAGIFDHLEFSRAGVDNQKTGTATEARVYQIIESRASGADCNFHGYLPFIYLMF
jgi:hypothetical protein